MVGMMTSSIIARPANAVELSFSSLTDSNLILECRGTSLKEPTNVSDSLRVPSWSTCFCGRTVVILPSVATRKASVFQSARTRPEGDG